MNKETRKKEVIVRPKRSIKIKFDLYKEAREKYIRVHGDGKNRKPDPNADGFTYSYPESLSGGKWPYPSGGS